MSPKEPLSHDRDAAAWVGVFALGAFLILCGGGGLAMVLVILATMKG